MNDCIDCGTSIKEVYTLCNECSQKPPTQCVFCGIENQDGLFCWDCRIQALTIAEEAI